MKKCFAVVGFRLSVCFWTIAAVILPLGREADAQRSKAFIAPDECYAFVVHDDLYTACGKATTRITTKEDVEDFAIDGREGTLAIKRMQPHRANEMVFLYSLKDGRLISQSQTTFQHELSFSCGMLLETVPDPKFEGKIARSQPLYPQNIVALPKFENYKCSDNMKIVMGWNDPQHLYTPLGTSSINTYTGNHEEWPIFDVSQNGRVYEYYLNQVVCVGSKEMPSCVDTLAYGRMSVSNDGEVLLSIAHCPHSKSKEQCGGLALWRKGMKEEVLIQPDWAHRPQWVSRKTALQIIRLRNQLH